MANAGQFMDDIISGVKSAGKGAKNLYHSNQAINKVGKNFGGAFEMGAKVLGNDKMGIGEAAVRTFATNADDLYKNGKRIVDANGKAVGKANLNYGKIAGSYIGASAALRVASGGGVYKDKNGNGNLMGVPFI